jgi:methanogenic corrinoid protein MtbC1
MFAILLRHDGYFVEYLGPDLPVQDLVDYAESIHPKIICLSISAEEPASMLEGLQDALNELPGKPLLAYGGRYFNENVAARERLGGIYLGKNLSEGVQKIHALMPVPEMNRLYRPLTN